MGHDARPINQHWVPQFYLRYFAKDGPMPENMAQIWCTDLTLKPLTSRTSAIKKICAKRYMYSPRIDETSREWSLDDQLGRLETSAAEMWPYLIEGKFGDLDVAAKSELAAFVAALHLRNYYLHELTGSSMVLRDQLYGRPEGKLRGKWRLGDSDPSDAARTFANSVVDSLPKVTSSIAAKSWCSVISEQGEFFTSDRPVVIMRGSRRSSGVAGYGVLALPLSPHHALFMCEEEVGPHSQVAKLAKDLIGTLNFWQGLKCNRFVLSHVDPESLPISFSFAQIQEFREKSRASKKVATT